MIRVLQVISGLDYGGVSAAIMNYYRHIDRSKIQFDFTTTMSGGRFEKEIEELGGRIYRIPSKFRHPLKYMKELKRIIVANDYDIVHSNANSASAFLDLLPAKLAKCKVRIAHSHASQCLIKWQHYIFKPLLPTVANARFACSEEAGKWMFGSKSCVIIKNGIDFEKYAYDEKTETTVRKEHGWEENFIIGHVGAFNEIKNQKFLINLLPSLVKSIPNVRLVMIGNGELLEETRKVAVDLKVDDKVVFMGNRNDVPVLLQGMDAFCLPSLAEGLGLAYIEAQAAGVPSIISDGVPYVCFDETNKVIQLDLKEELWVDKIKEIYFSGIKKKKLSEDIIAKSNYDINTIVSNLETEYARLIGE